MLIKKKIYNKLIKFRKLIKTNLQIKRNLYKFLLICDFNNFNNLAIKLLKLNFLNLNITKSNSFKPFKNLIIKSKLINYNNQTYIYFKFTNLKNLITLLNQFKKLTIIPFIIYPLFILNKLKNLILPLNYLKLNILNNLKAKKLIFIIIIKLLKNLILNLFIKFNSKLKCQL